MGEKFGKNEDVTVDKCNVVDKGKQSMVQESVEDQEKIEHDRLQCHTEKKDAEITKIATQALGKERNQITENFVEKMIVLNTDQIEDNYMNQKPDSVIGNHVHESDEECEKVWHDEYDDKQRNYVQSGSAIHMVQTGACSNDPITPRINGGMGSERDIVLGYSSDKEEGEISLIMGKEKAYTSEGDICVAAESEGIQEDHKTVRKSQRVHT